MAYRFSYRHSDYRRKGFCMIQWFFNTKAGQFLSKVCAAAVLLFTVFSFGIRKGKQSEQQKQHMDNLKTIKKKKDIENESSALSDADLDADNDAWLRK